MERYFREIYLTRPVLPKALLTTCVEQETGALTDFEWWLGSGRHKMSPRRNIRNALERLDELYPLALENYRSADCAMENLSRLTRLPRPAHEF